jgi:hypothetical protein
MGVYVQREEGKTNAHYSHMKSGLTDTCGEEGRQGGLGAGGVRGKTGELEALRAKEKGKTDRRGGGMGGEMCSQREGGGGRTHLSLQ